MPFTHLSSLLNLIAPLTHKGAFGDLDMPSMQLSLTLPLGDIYRAVQME